MAEFGRTHRRREYPETRSVGDCFGSLRAGAQKWELIQARQNPHRLASKREDARESDRPTGHFMTHEPKAQGFVRSAPSL